jgi:hypothetical protein
LIFLWTILSPILEVHEDLNVFLYNKSMLHKQNLCVRQRVHFMEWPNCHRFVFYYFFFIERGVCVCWHCWIIAWLRNRNLLSDEIYILYEQHRPSEWSAEMFQNLKRNETASGTGDGVGLWTGAQAEAITWGGSGCPEKEVKLG